MTSSGPVNIKANLLPYAKMSLADIRLVEEEYSHMLDRIDDDPSTEDAERKEFQLFRDDVYGENGAGKKTARAVEVSASSSAASAGVAALSTPALAASTISTRSAVLAAEKTSDAGRPKPSAAAGNSGLAASSASKEYQKSAMSRPALFYRVLTEDLIRLGGDQVILELIGHLRTSPDFEWHTSFYVQIDLDTSNDTDGLKYWNSQTDENPFMIMGYSDTGFFTTVALLRAVGTGIN